MGYRLFDCAPVYFNEMEIGNAFHEATSGVSRSDVFVTSKLAGPFHRPEHVEVSGLYVISVLTSNDGEGGGFYANLLFWGLCFSCTRTVQFIYIYISNYSTLIIIQPALRKTLHDLRLGYLDLFLIHWPVVGLLLIMPSFRVSDASCALISTCAFILVSLSVSLGIPIRRI